MRLRISIGNHLFIGSGVGIGLGIGDILSRLGYYLDVCLLDQLVLDNEWARIRPLLSLGHDSNLLLAIRYIVWRGE